MLTVRVVGTGLIEAVGFPSQRSAREMLSYDGHRLGIVPLHGGAAGEPNILAGRIDATPVFSDGLSVPRFVDAD